MIEERNQDGIIPIHQLGDYHPIEGYLVGQGKKMSVSLQNYIVVDD